MGQWDRNAASVESIASHLREAQQGRVENNPVLLRLFFSGFERSKPRKRQ
jgi:hypothetical protein